MALEGIPNPQTGSFYNALADPVFDATVPEMIEQTNDLVTEFLNANRTFAEDAIANATSIIDELRNATMPDELPDPPLAPSVITSFSSELGLGFEDLPPLGEISYDSTFEIPFNPTAITIPDVTSGMPDYVPTVDSLAIPEAPTYIPPWRPSAPVLNPVSATPEVPDFGTAPAIYDITLPAYVAPVLPSFDDDPPEFNDEPPNPVIGWVEPEYQSDIKDRVAAVLTEMLAGGTGLPEEVEAGIWERERAREYVAANTKIAAMLDEWANRGFTHPQGYLSGSIHAARDESEQKINDQSRAVAIEQAKLEQANRQFAVQYGISYEQVFTALFLAIVARNFEIAKFAVETAITIYNLRIARFNVQQAIFAQKTERQRILLEGALAYIKAYEAMTNVERAKADISVGRMQAFSALVKAKADAYTAEIEGIKAEAENEKNRMEVFKAEIEGMVADINGQRATFEAFGERVRGEAAKATLEEANARAYDSKVRAFATKQDLFFKRADVQIQANRQQLEWVVANMTRLTNKHGIELQRIQANLAGYQQGATVAVARYNAQQTEAQADLQAQLGIGNINIAKYQALLEQWRVRAQQIISMANLNADSMKAAGQMAATIVAGALAGTHVSAGISAGATAGKSHGTSVGNSSTQTNTKNEQTGYQVNHNFQHRV